MARAAITPVHTCAVCRKKTTRLLGFTALVTLVADGSGRPSRHTAVLGTCAAHRDQISEQFADEVAAKGTVTWMCDEPFALRPDEVEGWYADMDHLYAEAIRMSGSEPAGGAAIPMMTDPDNLPQDCPHCGGEISWGTGPHVAEAAARANAQAWECLGCRSAGMLVIS